jgi:signal transduction histidine kinase/CheY-like chemotaxis protein
LGVTVLLAAALLGPRAAAGLAVVETALLLPLRGAIPTLTSTEIAVALATLWAVLVLMIEIYRPVRALAGWSREYMRQARAHLEEARDRQAQLKDALDALTHANRQLALSNEKFAAMRLLAEEAQKTKAAFVANVSHEFRTPLNIILGLAEIMLDAPETYGEALPAAVRRDLRILNRNCEHLSTMINDVLDLSQVEAGRLALHREPVDLRALTDSAIVVVRPLLDKKGLRLEAALPTDLPLIHGDRTRIRQVILNLVSNAARFTTQGGIEISGEVQGQYVVMRVRDSGPGIAAEDAERIFEPFQQAPGTQNRYGGSGLGLTISKQFVELHGGKMWLESQPGIGSTFSFRLPISPLNAPLAPPGRWITEGWVERTTRAALPETHLEQRVILCDATGELHPLFTRYADQISFVDVRNLAQAEAALRETAAQALILNADTPAALTLALDEAATRLADVPIIGCALAPKAAPAQTAGATQYLLKPFTRADLKAQLEALPAPVHEVLIVDDDADNLDLLSRLLRANDATLSIRTASGGAQALAELRAQLPDLVFLDLVMPDMDGWQVLAAKNEEERMREVPVVIVSAQDPRDAPVTSPLLAATMGKGLSISKVLRCSQALAALLLQPD